MSGIVPVRQADIFAAVFAQLQDLSQFGIHLSPVNPSHQCCRCGASTQGYSEGYGYDNLCNVCNWGAPFGTINSRKDSFYTNATVYVSNPIEGQTYLPSVWNGVRTDYHTYHYMVALVKIDRCPYLLRAFEGGIGSYSNMYTLQGNLIMENAISGLGYRNIDLIILSEHP